MTANELANVLGVTPKWIAALVKDGMPRTSRNDFDLGRCMHWYIRHLQNALAARESSPDGSITGLMTERTKQARGQTERMATANREALVAADVRRDAMRAIEYLGASLAPVARRITTDASLQARIENELQLAQAAFANNLSALTRAPKPTPSKRRKH